VERPERRPDARDPGPVPGVIGGDLAARLERWAAEARVDEAARTRSRERWLRRQAEESGTLAGVLADLLEAGRAVVVHSRSGRIHRGTLRAVGADFVAVGGIGAGGSALVALAAVASVRTPPGERRVVGDRDAPASPVRLADVVAGMAADRERVLVVTGDGDAVAGVLLSVGRDVAVVRGEGEPPATCYVPLAAVTEIMVDT